MAHSQNGNAFVCGLSTRKISTPWLIQNSKVMFQELSCWKLADMFWMLMVALFTSFIWIGSTVVDEKSGEVARESPMPNG